MKNQYIACVAGKSGGHIIPCLTYARTIKTADQKILFFSNNTSLDYTLLRNQSDIAHHYAYSLQSRSTIVGIITTIIETLQATRHTYKTLKQYQPEHVVSTGGLISIPVFIASWLLKIPSTLCELNATPGKAARVCGFFASTINVCFRDTASYFAASKTKIIPYPLKPEIIEGAQTRHRIKNNKKTVFIIGGSQGSVSLNNTIKKLIATYPNLHSTIAIIHQTGTNDTTDWPYFYAQHGIDAISFPFSQNLIPYYQQADIIITRAGAGILFEIMAFKKKCIIVPLEIKQTDHQVDNAQAFVAQYPDLCVMVREADLDKNITLLYDKIGL